jgi:hypothetical protein
MLNSEAGNRRWMPFWKEVVSDKNSVPPQCFSVKVFKNQVHRGSPLAQICDPCLVYKLHGLQPSPALAGRARRRQIRASEELRKTFFNIIFSS